MFRQVRGHTTVAHGVFESLGDQLDQAVGALPSDPVEQVREVVQGEDHHGGGRRRQLTAQLFEQGRHLSPVGQSGQRVVQRLRFELPLQQVTGGHVRERHDRSRLLPTFEQRNGVQGRDDPLAVRPREQHLRVVHRDAGPQGLHGRVRPGGQWESGRVHQFPRGVEHVRELPQVRQARDAVRGGVRLNGAATQVDQHHAFLEHFQHGRRLRLTAAQGPQQLRALQGRQHLTPQPLQPGQLRVPEPVRCVQRQQRHRAVPVMHGHDQCAAQVARLGVGSQRDAVRVAQPEGPVTVHGGREGAAVPEVDLRQAVQDRGRDVLRAQHLKGPAVPAGHGDQAAPRSRVPQDVQKDLLLNLTGVVQGFQGRQARLPVR